jgi:hypothetical protein
MNIFQALYSLLDGIKFAFQFIIGGAMRLIIVMLLILNGLSSLAHDVLPTEDSIQPEYGYEIVKGMNSKKITITNDQFAQYSDEKDPERRNVKEHIICEKAYEVLEKDIPNGQGVVYRHCDIKQDDQGSFVEFKYFLAKRVKSLEEIEAYWTAEERKRPFKSTDEP